MCLGRACSALSRQGDHERLTRRVDHFLVRMIINGASCSFSLEAMRQYAALILHVSITILYSWDQIFDPVYLSLKYRPVGAVPLRIQRIIITERFSFKPKLQI
jgi:hypothetical protein